MPAKKRSFDDPNEPGKLEVYRDLEERVFNDALSHSATENHSPDKPGKSIIEAALAERDTGLLRKIAAERKGLTDQQRRALLLVADLLDGAAKGRAAHA
jgi:hypothetical protein